jgi:glycosyltransferase involved in cell wall biosynthesis
VTQILSFGELGAILRRTSSEGQVLILIPMFNEERFIERCLNSIMNQSYENWLLYISDNASTDSSLAIARAIALKNEKIRVIERQKPVAPAKNWNELADLSFSETNPEFVMWLAADDFLENEGYLKNMTRNCIKDAIIPSFKNCREDGSYYLNHTFSTDCTYKTSLLNHIQLAKNWANVVAVYGLYRASVFKELLQADSSRITDDPESDWWWTFALHKQFKVTSSPCDFYVKTIKKNPFYVIPQEKHSLRDKLRILLLSNLNLRLINQAISQRKRITVKNFPQFFYTLVLQLIFMTLDKIRRTIFPGTRKNLVP